MANIFKAYPCQQVLTILGSRYEVSLSGVGRSTPTSQMADLQLGIVHKKLTSQGQLASGITHLVTADTRHAIHEVTAAKINVPGEAGTDRIARYP